MDFRIINGVTGFPNLKHDFEVHTWDCKDGVKYDTKGFTNWKMTALMAEDAVKAQVDEFHAQDMDWEIEHFHVHNCCKKHRAYRKAAQQTSSDIVGTLKEALKQGTSGATMDINEIVKKNNERVMAAMAANGIKVGEAIDPKTFKKFQQTLANSAPKKKVAQQENKMTFAFMTNVAKPKRPIEVHTPSCKRVDRLKARGYAIRKFDVDRFVEDAIKKADVKNPKVHTCCKPFEKTASTNPPCPNCKSSSTVFASNLGVGKKQFTCTGCKKLFVVNNPKKDKTMKIKVQKQDAAKAETKTAAKTSTKKTSASKEKRAKARAAKKAEREQRRADRKQARLERMFARAGKFVARFAKMGLKVDALSNELGVLAQDAGVKMGKAKAAKSKSTRKAKRAVKK
jgi:transposase-like protein